MEDKIKSEYTLIKQSKIAQGTLHLCVFVGVASGRLFPH